MRKNIYYILALLVHELHWLNALAQFIYLAFFWKKKDNFKPLSFVSTYKSKNQFDLSLALFRTWLWALYIRFNQVSGSHQSTGTSDAVSYNHFRLFRFFDPLDKNGYLPSVLSSMKLPSKSFKICQWSIYYMGFCIPKIWPIFEAFSLKYNGAFSYSKKKKKLKWNWFSMEYTSLNK